MATSSKVIESLDDDVTASGIGSSGDEQAISDSAVKSKKRKLDDEVTETAEWTDYSDDIGYEAFKKRKKLGDKDKSSRKSKGKAVARQSSSGPGKKKRQKRRGRPWQKANDSDTESDEDFLENALPNYLRERRQEFDRKRETLREAGLRLPPDYSDIYFSDDEKLEDLEEKPVFDEESGIKLCREYKDLVLEHSAGVIPASIAQYLPDYQVEGVRFLHRLFVYQQGGILGDDMGLGKTVQVAAFLTTVFGKTGDIRDAKRMRKIRRNTDRWYPRVLIVCPGTVATNWENELNRWGWWTIDNYHGPNKSDVLRSANAGRLEIMITPYGTYSNHCDEINRVAWDVIIADECHSIKNGGTLTTKTMNQVNALCRIGLTGTAIQNRYEELWTLLNWTNPGVFGTLGEWKQTICKPLTIGQSHDATLYQLSEARKTAKRLVQNLLPRFFLRRMKSLIAHQLPKKTDKVVFCPLSDVQQEAYETLLESDLVQIVKNAYQECDCGSEKKRGWCCYERTVDGESWKKLVFPLMISLQKLSNHVLLMAPTGDDPVEKKSRAMRYLKAAMPRDWKELCKSRESILSQANPVFCGKWTVLKKLVQFWHRSGDKVLIFSHNVRLLVMLRHLFNNTSYSVSYLDGSMKYADRQKVVDDFNSDPEQFIFLISTKAGGVGLNITSSNKVVIMDPHWNPAYDLQAQDRAYRIGQWRDVEVFRLISAGTIEEITYARQIYKQQQANIGYTASNERRYFKGVQQDKSRKGEIFGLDNIFSYHGDQVVMREIVNKTNIAEAKTGISIMDVNVDEAAEDAAETQVIKKEEGADVEDKSLNQLAAFLTRDDSKDTKPKRDAIQAILASAGVEYTHENSEVIGTSKVEDQLSRRAALEASQEMDPMARALFVDSEDEGLRDGDANAVRYNPPEDVLQRQFCTMAKLFGFPSATEFALAVEGMSQEQRRNCLDLFYRKRTERLGEVKAEAGVKDEDEDVKVEIKDEMLRLVKDEDEKKVVDTKVKDEELKDVSLSGGEEKVKKEEPSSVIVNKGLSASIWLSDDDDEL